MLDPLRILRRRERFQQNLEAEMSLFIRRYGDKALTEVLAKLERDDLTSRYRKLLTGIARRLHSDGWRKAGARGP